MRLRATRLVGRGKSLGGGAAAVDPNLALCQTLLLVEGDSIVAGGVGGVTTYNVRWCGTDGAQPLTVRTQGVITGIAGRQLSGVVSSAAADQAYFTARNYAWRDALIYYCAIGTNDSNGTVATFLSNYAAHLDSMRAALNPLGAKVVIGTILFRNGSGAQNTFIATANAAFRTWVGVHIDGLVDFQTDPILNDFNNMNNPLYSSDGIHPTDALYALMYNVAAPVWKSFTSVQNPAQFQPWDTVDKDPGITLSGANYIAGSNTGAAWHSLRTSKGRDHGKYYTEILISGNSQVLAGVGCAYENRNTFHGQTRFSLAYWPGTGILQVGFTVVNAPTLTFTLGQRLAIHVDFDAGKMWLGPNGVIGAAGDPATGANPSYAFTPNTELYISGSFNNSAGTLQLPANAGELVHTKASGYSVF